MKVNLYVPKVEIVQVEVPDEMLTNIIFDNCKANWDKRPQTAVAPGRDDYKAVENYIGEHYGYAFVEDFADATVETSDGEEVTVLEY